MQHVLQRPQSYRRASLDGIVFKTVGSQTRVQSDHSHIMQDYIEEKTKEVCRAYGKITSMFMHEMYPESPARMVVECEWYECVGVNPTSQNVQVRRNENWDCHLAFLDTCVPASCMFWPSDPWGDDDGLMDVIKHHE